MPFLVRRLAADRVRRRYLQPSNAGTGPNPTLWASIASPSAKCAAAARLESVPKRSVAARGRLVQRAPRHAQTWSARDEGSALDGDASRGRLR